MMSLPLMMFAVIFTKPDKVICIGLNYREHCLETNIPIPVEPLVFSKFPSSIIGPIEKIPYPENVSDV